MDGESPKELSGRIDSEQLRRRRAQETSITRVSFPSVTVRYRYKLNTYTFYFEQKKMMTYRNVLSETFTTATALTIKICQVHHITPLTDRRYELCKLFLTTCCKRIVA